MLVPQISGLGLQIMEGLWADGPASIREIHDRLAEDDRPKINTTRATFHRLVHHGYVRQVRQVHRSAVFEAAVTRESVYEHAVDSFAELFDGRMSDVIARLAATGRLGPADLDALREALRHGSAKAQAHPLARPKLVKTV
jgi:predicted transcriptional regulator